MRTIPEPFDRDISVFAASQLTTGIEIVNVGTVVGRREEGAFVHVAIERDVWDQTRGIPVRTVEWRFFHATDDIWVFDPPQSPRKFDPTFGGKVVAPEGEV